MESVSNGEIGNFSKNFSSEQKLKLLYKIILKNFKLWKN